MLRKKGGGSLDILTSLMVQNICLDGRGLLVGGEAGELD